ncbi:ParB N-terminal domain-containing protein [Roseburia inulinivorans]
MSQLYWVVASETHLVRTNPYGDGYEVISGHRRKEAAIWAGETKVPVVVRELDEGKIAFTIGMELSYLSEEEQYHLCH